MKYYYTDPLAAQWMSSKFEMKFQELVSVMRDEVFRDEMRDIFSVHCVDFIPSMGRYYIHPDSLHLLEPLSGDFIIREDNAQPHRWTGRGVGVRKIIQRNGIPFMWPEVEE